MTVITRASDEYLYIPLLWASLLALAVPAVFYLIELKINFLDVYIVQIICFVVALILFRIPPVTIRLIPMHVKQQRARRLAHEQFFRQGLHHTQERTGVLLFVSLAERYVEIIADKGINDIVKPGTWDSVVDNFVTAIKNNNISDGFIAAIEACGKILQENFPAQSPNVNELPDRLVEL